MNTPTKQVSEGNPVLRLVARWAGDAPAASYRKGWQLAQRLLDQCQKPALSRSLR